jgi:DNA-binding beta-propeller fold protein YncE
VTFEFQKLHHRRLIGATAVATALAAAGLAAACSAGAASTPVLESLSYTQTGPGGGLYHPVGVSAYNGTVYVSNSGANVVSAITGSATTAFARSLSAYGEHRDGDGEATSASLYHPGGLTVDASGDVYIADTYNNRVLKVTPSGRVTAVAGDGTAGYSGGGRLGTFAELNEPTGVAVDARSDLYIADSANNVIRRVDAKTGIITTMAGDYAADKANDGLGGFSGDGGPATRAELNDPQGVAIDGAGDLFVADTFNNAIREVTPAGVITTVVNTSAQPGGETSGAATASRLNTPYGVAIDPSTGDLYIADTNNSRIAEVTGLAQSGDAAGPVAPARS